VSVRVQVSMPVYGDIKAQTVHSLIPMLCAFTMDRVAGSDGALSFLTDMGTIIFKQRENLAEMAVEDDATHVLWVDGDMTFPADALERLLAHDKDIVGCNYSRRRRPCVPTARKDGVWVYPDEHTGLIEVEAVGMGLCLVKADVFKAMEKPWFNFARNPKTGQGIGEDFYFCYGARHAGFKVWCDMDLSAELGHVGDHTYQLEDAITDRAYMIEQQAKEAAE
jgi:hypothetical protein